MSSPKLITVFGATGLQGGSVARALLTNSAYRVRGVTRNTESDKSKALAASGVELVTANFDDKESLKKAIEGSHGVFVVTNFWEHLNYQKEIQQGKNAADACKEVGVKHLVYSGLDAVQDQIGESCPHFDAKAEVEKYIKAQNIPHTCARISAYMETIMGIMTSKPADDGTYAMGGVPMEGKPLCVMSVAEYGPCVHQVFNQPDRFLGKTIAFASDKVTMQQVADSLMKIFPGRKYVPNPMTTQDFAKQGFPGADDLAVMFRYYQKDLGIWDIALTKELNPKAPTFEKFLTENKHKL